MGVKLGISYLGKNIDWGVREEGVFSHKSGEVIKVCRKLYDEKLRVEERNNLENLGMDGRMY